MDWLLVKGGSFLTSKEQSFKNSIKLNEQEQEGQNKILRSYYEYNSFIDNRYDEFKTSRRKIQNILIGLINKEKIGTDISIISRIKSYQSTMRNKKRGKTLDDIFGTTILAETQEELAEIEKTLQEQAQIIKIKRVDQTRFQKYKYRAIHILLELDLNDPSIQIEVHLQTKKDFKEAYPHMEYKLLQDKSIEESKLALLITQRYIQEMYNKKSNKMQLIIPYMWESKFDKEKNKFYERQLKDDEILKRMYPFLELEDKEIVH